MHLEIHPLCSLTDGLENECLFRTIEGQQSQCIESVVVPLCDVYRQSTNKDLGVFMFS